MNSRFSKIALCGAALLGSAAFVACDDTTNVYQKPGIDMLEKGKEMPDCEKSNAGDMLYVSDSLAVYFCADGEWAALNGSDGAEGEAGAKGEQGEQGETGEKGKPGAAGTSCTAKSVKKGIEVSCGGVVIDTLTNGAQGKPGTSCTAKSVKNGIEVSCDGVVIDTLTNGKPGERGNDGYSCSVSQNSAKDTTTITCETEDGDVSYKVANGSKGDGGEGCEITDKKDGEVTIKCGDSDPVTLFKAMCGGKPYDPENFFCYEDSAYACGDKPYNPKKEFCHEGEIFSCGDKPYDPTKEYCLTLESADQTEYRIEDLLLDSRDGKKYKTVTIGNQVWMAENLNHFVYDDAYDDNYTEEQKHEGTHSMCYGQGGNDGLTQEKYEANCAEYGRLYTWFAVVDKKNGSCGDNSHCGISGKVQGICPEDWHVPTNTEWEMLHNTVGEVKKLKSKTGWSNDANGTDDYGFNALPSGFGNTWHSYGALLYNACFWTSTESATPVTYGNGSTSYSNAVSVCLLDDEDFLDDDLKENAFAVRCVKGSD